MSVHEEYMQLALREAEAALETDNLPVGAVVVLDDLIIGKGSRANKARGKLDHAEVLAVTAAFTARPKETERMVIYTTLEPCLMCLGTILNCRIHNIVYAFPDDFGGATRIPVEALPPRHQENKFEVVRDVCRTESQTLFREFFRTTDQEFWKNPFNPLVIAAFAD